MQPDNEHQKLRVWTDGCFDMMHYGHANALRQAKAMGDFLVVGVHTDAEILLNKGPTVLNEKERYAALQGCKWVDEVVLGAPYLTSLKVMDEYKCDICVHGDDISTLADGTDSYQLVKDAGRFKECKRTQGISTTELVGRMLLMTKTHHSTSSAELNSLLQNETKENEKETNSTKVSPYTGSSSSYLTTSKRIVQFSTPKEPKPSDVIVYVDGDFDLFHAGHISLLKKAKEMGDYVLVGVHDDKTVNEIKGKNYPLMNLQERVLSVLSCRYVDEVVIGAPYSVTKDLLSKIYKIAKVIHGKTELHLDSQGEDPYKIPKSMGIYVEVEHEFSYLTTEVIINRIIQQRQQYEERNRKKQAKEISLIEKTK